MSPRLKTLRVTLPALLAALSLILLYLSALLPSGRWGAVAAVGLLPAAAVISVGLWGGFACYAVVCLLGFLLVPNRLNMLLYALLFGLYPMVKSLLERSKRRWVGVLGKLAFFNGILTLFLWLFSALFVPALPEIARNRYWLVYLAGNGIFFLYDFGFTKLIALYLARVGSRGAPGGGPRHLE